MFLVFKKWVLKIQAASCNGSHTWSMNILAVQTVTRMYVNTKQFKPSVMWVLQNDPLCMHGLSSAILPAMILPLGFDIFRGEQ